jgi:predicted DNA-binding transcriptional regulator AlpA
MEGIEMEDKVLTVARLRELKNKPLLNVKDIMDLFNIKENTIYRWVKRGVLRPSRIQDKLYFRQGHIEQVLRDNVVKENANE